ncbi:MAG: polysaccharide pyruvyl transferase CsaB [Oscillospiraceae bacterium]
MKVIHLIGGGDTGGAKTHLLSLLSGLNEHIEAHLVSFREGDFAADARALGIPTTVMAGNNIPRICRRLEDMIREGGYEVIHCHGSRANMMGALLRRRLDLPVVSTIHSDYKLDYMGRRMGALVYGNINAWALRHMDYRIGVSDAMVDLLISRGFPPESFYAIYNGLDFTVPEITEDRLGYLRSLGAQVEEDSVVVGIAARLDPVKDIATLIRGFAYAYRTCDKLRLVIAGDGAEKERLQALARELGVEDRVCFAGWISGGMDRFYHALDVNTLTSLSETFPYVLTEGARHRLATVASRVGGIPQLIDHGVSGMLFPAGDDEALGRCLKELAEDEALRRRLGGALYEKASRRFSLENTIETQLHIYDEILRRYHRRVRQRDGVVICGAYGRGNAGDDAILQAIIGEMRSIDRDIPITVVSRNPQETRLTLRVNAVHTFHYFAWHGAMRRSRLYINGGGNLIQDVTSSRSLWYYLCSILSAKRSGCRVQMYGCGIGPLLREKHRPLVAKVLNRYVDAITLREPDSLEELRRIGVTVPRIELTADPALTLSPAEPERIDSVLLSAGIPVEGRYMAISLRNWDGFAAKAPLFGRLAEHVYEVHGLTPIFLSVEKKQDPQAAALAAEGIRCPHYFINGADRIDDIIGVLSRMEAVVSMRLHTLIFAAGQGTPLVGVVYDPKVSSFLRYIGEERYAELGTLTEAELFRLTDEAVQRYGDKDAQVAAVQRLRTIEHGNVARAEELLG